MSAARKLVAIQLPAAARSGAPRDGGSLQERYALELEALASHADIVEVDASSKESFIDGVRHADALITSWGIRIDRRIIENLQRCTVIGVGSVGVDMVDIAAATDAGIVVTNVPDVFIEEVADHAMMLLLAAARRVRATDVMVREGRWFDGRPLLSGVPRLMGQTLGLLGFGNVGRCVARRAAGFGLHLVAHDPYISELSMSEAGVEPVSFGELLERADYLSVHTPLNTETRHLLNADALARMKRGATVINTARGPIIDEAALIDALRTGQIGAAGLDVLEQEPPATENPLLGMNNVVLTPHAASATTRMRPETRRRVGREVALVLSGRWPMSCVNPTVLPRVALERWQPYPISTAAGLQSSSSTSSMAASASSAGGRMAMPLATLRTPLTAPAISPARRFSSAEATKPPRDTSPRKASISTAVTLTSSERARAAATRASSVLSSMYSPVRRDSGSTRRLFSTARTPDRPSTTCVAASRFSWDSAVPLSCTVPR